MTFKPLPGNQGMIYVPESRAGKKKHPCPDCFSCQWCGNERCRTCRPNICRKRKKRRQDAAGTGEEQSAPQDHHEQSGEPETSSPPPNPMANEVSRCRI
ncbi:MAG: hypothetical protein ACOY4W_04630 [Thermodesulfobacteriota bacterium]